MLTCGCLFQGVKVSTRMVYKKDWCGDGMDKYTGSALVSMDIEITNKTDMTASGKLRAVISPVSGDGEKIVSTRDLTVSPGQEVYKMSVTVPDVHLWNTWDIGEPDLYDLNLEFRGEVKCLRIGIKEVGFNEKTGEWTINRKKLYLRGLRVTKKHTDIAALKELGFNAVYVANNEAEKDIYEQCDELGILMCEACAVAPSDMNPEGITALSEAAARSAKESCNHASHGMWALDIRDEVYRTADSKNANLALCNVLYEAIASVDPSKTVFFPGKAQTRAAAVFCGKELATIDPRMLKLPFAVLKAGFEDETQDPGLKELKKWEADYLRIRKYDPVSAVFLADEDMAEEGYMKPVHIAFEPGYVTDKNGETASIEAGKTFTSRIWAINDLHHVIPDVKLSWSITSEDDGKNLAGNSFRLNLNSDSAEIPDQVMFVTSKAEKGKTFRLDACIETDEEKLSENKLIVSVK